MTIRRAMPSDRFRVIRLLKDMHAASGFAHAGGLTGFVCPFDAAYVERQFLHHATAPDALCLVHAPGDVAQGVLMAGAYDYPFAPVRVAKEALWWIDPAHRGRAAVRMLDAYEAWAFIEKRCAFAGMAGMGGDPEVAKLYLRRGYRVAETHYLKAA